MSLPFCLVLFSKRSASRNMVLTTFLASSVLSEEIETTMRCMGVTSLDQLSPAFVNTKRLELELPDSLAVSPEIRAKL